MRSVVRLEEAIGLWLVVGGCSIVLIVYAVHVSHVLAQKIAKKFRKVFGRKDAK